MTADTSARRQACHTRRQQVPTGFCDLGGFGRPLLRARWNGRQRPDPPRPSWYRAASRLRGRIGKCFPRHRAVEFRKFLDEIEANLPPDLDVHLVLDNSATHKTKLIRDWLAKRTRYHVHFTPTSASWINQVERWFALLTEKQIRRGVHQSVADLERDIRLFIESTNAEPKPFRWVKSADDILASVKRFCLRTASGDQERPIFVPNFRIRTLAGRHITVDQGRVRLAPFPLARDGTSLRTVGLICWR